MAPLSISNRLLPLVGWLERGGLSSTYRQSTYFPCHSILMLVSYLVVIRLNNISPTIYYANLFIYIYILILFYLSPFINPFENISHIFLFSSLIFTSEREYRCLGNWEEDGVLYTFTQRRDMPGHQCFVSNYFVLFFFCCFVIIDSCNNFDSILYKKLYCKIMKLFFSLSYKTGRQSLSQW